MNLLQDSSIEEFKKCANIRTIIISIVLLVVGGYVSAYALHLTDSLWSSLILLVGCTTMIFAVFNLCFHATHYIYVPTGSEVKKVSLNYEAKKFFSIWEDIYEKFGFRPLNCFAEQSEIRLDCVYSKDGKFAALQLSQYSSLLYTPITGVYELKDEKATLWVECLSKLSK